MYKGRPNNVWVENNKWEYDVLLKIMLRNLIVHEFGFWSRWWTSVPPSGELGVSESLSLFVLHSHAIKVFLYILCHAVIYFYKNFKKSAGPPFRANEQVGSRRTYGFWPQPGIKKMYLHQHIVMYSYTSSDYISQEKERLTHYLLDISNIRQ